MELTATELKAQDPRRFEKEYWKWTEYAADHDWWDCIEDDFKSDMAQYGVDVRSIAFSLGYCQSDYAGFEGRVNLADWLRSQGYGESHLPLMLDMGEYGAWSKIDTPHRGGYASTGDLDYQPGNVYPCGVFSDLPQEAWDELIEQQWMDRDWEREIDGWLRERSKELYRRLQEEYEYLTSEEQFIESCEVNGVTFEIEGEEA